MKQEAGEQSILKAQRERDTLASDKAKAKDLTTQNQKASMASRERAFSCFLTASAQRNTH